MRTSPSRVLPALPALAALCAFGLAACLTLTAPALHAQPQPAASAASASQDSTTTAPRPPADFPAAPDIAARSYLLIDVSAGSQILAAKALDEPMEPASLTKLMTAYIVFDALKAGRITLEQTFGVSEKAWKMPGSRMFIDPKMQVRVEDLIKGMIVQSGNDATMALAEGLAGSEEAFVQKMNATAQTLGMRRTHYHNPEGLTAPGHTTTARDMALLAVRLLNDFPQYTAYYAIKQWHYTGTPESNQNNRNTLLFRDPTVDGLKTGHTAAAGYNLIATASRAMPNLPQGRRLLAVVFGTASENARANETQKLLNWGYTAYEGIQLYAANQTITDVRIWKGHTGTVSLGQTRPLAIAVPTGRAKDISVQIERTDPLLAPLPMHQPVGRIQILFAGQPLVNHPLLSLQAVEQGHILRRLWDSIVLMFKGKRGG